MTLISSDFAALTTADLRCHWHGRSQFTVLQNGVGDGGQLLQIWNSLRDDDAAAQRVHYLIIDSQPPTAQQLAQLPEPLRRCWPLAVTGYQRVAVEQSRLILTLVTGDVASCLPQLDAQVDLFLLRDDPLWTPALLKWLGRLAAPQARMLIDGQSSSLEQTLTESLQKIGFVPECEGQASPAVFAPRWLAPVTAATALSGDQPQDQRHAIVIGAGLAGSAACESLAARGWKIDLIEQHAHAAQEASGNLAGVYMPAISRDDNPTARLTRVAFLFAQQVWQRSGVFATARGAGQACGVLQVARDDVQAQAFEQAAQHWRYPRDYAQWLPAAEASARLGLETGSGWFFPHGGWLRPALVCATMLEACGDRVQRHFCRTAVSLQRVDQLWQVVDADGRLIAQAPVVILANGMQATRFAQADTLPLQAIRGQVSHVPAGALPDLPFVLCGDGYLTGAVDGMVSVGASYDQDADPALRVDSHLGNLDKLGQLLRRPGLTQQLAQSVASDLQGRVGFRCVSADRLPLVGALPDLDSLAKSGEVQLREVPRQPQLYGLLAYASRGLIWAPLAAEILACRLDGEPAPLGKDLLALLDPARFALKLHRHHR